MHILFVVPYAASLIRTRPYHLIRHFTQRWHRLTILTLVADADEEEDVAALSDMGVKMIAEPLSRGRSLANSLAAAAARPMPDSPPC